MTTDITATQNGVTLNPKHGLWYRGDVLVQLMPGGFWAVKVARTARAWTVYAVPRRGTRAEPFLIGYGGNYQQALFAGIKWRYSAATLVMRMDRIVFAGTGDVSLETLPGFDPARLLPEAVAG